jgi:hypothetical protein
MRIKIKRSPAQKLYFRPRCGLLVIDLQREDIVHSVRIDGVILELYDVVTLRGIRRPMAISLRTDEIRRVVTVE